MNALQQAVRYASDRKHDGAAFSLLVTTTTGPIYVEATGSWREHRFYRREEGTNGIEVFINPAQVVSVEVIW